MLDDSFLDSVRYQKYHTFGGNKIISKSDLYDMNWGWITKFVDTHPRKDSKGKPTRKALALRKWKCRVNKKKK